MKGRKRRKNKCLEKWLVKFDDFYKSLSAWNEDSAKMKAK